MWNAERDANGKLIVRRSVAERDDWSDEEIEYAQNVNASAWGLFGASLVDDPMFGNDFSTDLREHLNRSAKLLIKQGHRLDRVPSWRELKRAFGEELINDIRDHVSTGIKARQASKYFNIPLVMAYDVIDGYKEFDKKALKEVINSIKSEGFEKACNRFGKVAGEIGDIFGEYSETGSHKIAVDEAAKDYWVSYLGPFGAELIRDIKKRVRADMASAFLKKQGVDEAARKYYEDYYGNYGVLLTKGDVTKRRL